jgi:hypothetical protein|tara:strand:- start:426 stop:692 length:267 start_codon:yes stop_codon:yes gene_type:complete
MKNNYSNWLKYVKEEENAITGSLRLYYRKLKELHRDKALILDSMGNKYDSAIDAKTTLLDYVSTQILIYENKVKGFIKDEKGLPNFHD